MPIPQSKINYNIRLVLEIVCENLQFLTNITSELKSDPEKIIRANLIWFIDKFQLRTNGDISVTMPEERSKISYIITYKCSKNRVSALGERDVILELDCSITQKYMAQLLTRIEREKLGNILSTDFINGEIFIEAVNIKGTKPPIYKIFGTATEILD